MSGFVKKILPPILRNSRLPTQPCSNMRINLRVSRTSSTRSPNSLITRTTRSELCNCRPKTSVNHWKPTLPTGRTFMLKVYTRRLSPCWTSSLSTLNTGVPNWARKYSTSILWEMSWILYTRLESNRQRLIWNSTQLEICTFFWISTSPLASPIRMKWITDKCWENIGMSWSNKLKLKPRSFRAHKTSSWKL